MRTADKKKNMKKVNQKVEERQNASRSIVKKDSPSKKDDTN